MLKNYRPHKAYSSLARLFPWWIQYKNTKSTLVGWQSFPWARETWDKCMHEQTYTECDLKNIAIFKNLVQSKHIAVSLLRILPLTLNTLFHHSNCFLKQLWKSAFLRVFSCIIVAVWMPEMIETLQQLLSGWCVLICLIYFMWHRAAPGSSLK